MPIQQFNIRVYGLLINNQEILISKEVYQGKELIKFPGGGVQFGEGVIEALKREFLEELNSEIIEHKLFHITENRIQSAFRKDEQIIAIYYLVEVNQKSFALTEHEIFWKKLEMRNLEQVGFTFPQDRLVFEKLCKSPF